MHAPSPRAALTDRRGLVIALVVVATLLGFSVRLYRLDHPAAWTDELITILYTKETWSRLAGDLVKVDVHPPLYYMLQKAWASVLGENLWEMRLLPVLLGTACIPLLFVLGQKLISSRVGVIAAFLLTTAPLHVFQSRELRMYSLLNVSVLVAIVGLACAMDRASQSRRLAWTAYIVGCVVAFYAHNTAILLPILAAVPMSILWMKGKALKRLPVEFAIASALILLAIVPWLGVLATHVRDTLSQFWIPKPTLGWVKSQLLGAYPYAPWLKLLILGFALGGLWTLRNHFAGAFVGTFTIGQPAMMWVASYFRPVLIVRALVWPTMLFMLLPAMFFSVLPAGVMMAATASFVALQATAIKAYYPAQRVESDAVRLAPYLVNFNPMTDTLVLGIMRFEVDLRPYVPHIFENKVFGMRHGDRRDPLEPLWRTQHVRRADIVGSLTGARRIWILSEVSPLFPIAPSDDVANALRSVEAMGRRVEARTVGNLALVVVEVP